MTEGGNTYIDTRDKNGMSELHHAAKDGDVEKVLALIETGADMHQRCNKGISPLGYAASEGRLEVAKALLDKGADVNT